MLNTLRKSRGQSTTEFALMMPVIMAFFFYIFQVNIYWSALNQSAWATYSGARTHLVLGGPSSGGKTAQRTVERILTGRLYQGANKPSVSTDGTLRGSGGPDGIKVDLKPLDSLPYVSNPNSPLLHFNNTISTHLGWQEYDQQKYTDTYERESPPQGKKMVTDNNLTDY